MVGIPVLVTTVGAVSLVRASVNTVELIVETGIDVPPPFLKKSANRMK